jgi:hypothetical protein
LELTDDKDDENEDDDEDDNDKDASAAVAVVVRWTVLHDLLQNGFNAFLSCSACAKEKKAFSGGTKKV